LPKQHNTSNSAHAAIEAWLRLFFWAMREAFVVVLLGAATISTVVALAEGRLPTELLSHPVPWQLPS
jgi:hypothetical protein